MTSTRLEIRDSSLNAAAFVWAFGVIWTALVMLFLWMGGLRATRNDPTLWFFLAFGLVILSLALFISLSAAKYGRSVFDSPMLPAICGGVLAGTIRIPKPLIYREPIHLRLMCLTRCAGEGSQQVIIWEERLSLDRFRQGATVSEIPVYFKIPAHTSPSSSSVSWRLDVKAKTGGINYGAMLRVPVASGPVPPAMQQIVDTTAALRSSEPPRRHPLDRHIQIALLPNRRCQVELLPGRNLVLGLSGTAFGVVFMGVACVVRAVVATPDKHSDQWFMTLWLFGFFGSGATCCFVGLRLLLLKTTVVVGEGVIFVTNSIGFGNRQREIHTADVVDITAQMQGGCWNRLFYLINAERRGKEPVKICGTIYDKGDAELLAAEFKKALALGPERSPS